MKTIRKILSLLLTLCMLMSMVCISYADTTEETEVTLPEKLLDLDLTNMTQSTTEGSSGVVNTVSDSAADIKIYGNSTLKIAKGGVANAAGGVTPYIHMTHSQPAWDGVGSNAYVSDISWADKDVTFSFWADLNTVQEENSSWKVKYIVDYFEKYTKEDETEEAKNVSILQVSKESTTPYVWNTSNSWEDEVNLDNSKGFTHVAIAKSKLNDGSKTVDLYINGQLWKSQTITPTEGATLTEATLTFGGKKLWAADSNGNYSWTTRGTPTDAKFADINAYNGVLNAEQIAKIYNDEKSHYDEYDITTHEKLFDWNLDAFTPGVTTEGNSGITNDGTSETAVISAYDYVYSSSSYVKNTKGRLRNSLGLGTHYIQKRNTCNGWNTTPHHLSISDTAWESEGTTFSFWTDVNMDTSWYQGKVIFSYTLTWDVDGSATTDKAELWQINHDTSTNHVWNTVHDSENTINMNNSRGWTNVVLTNPQADENGIKTMGLYINGKYIRDITVEVPDGGTLSSAVFTLGGYSDNTSNVPNNIDFGGVKVYKGTLYPEQIALAYENELPEFTAGGEMLLFDMDISDYNPNSTTASRGIKNAVKETGTATEIELKNGIRTINGNAYNSGTFDGGSYSNIDTELIPYVELNMSGFSSTNSTTPATARLFIDNPEWTGKSYTSEFWVKSYYENISAGHYNYSPIAFVYGGQDASNRSGNMEDKVYLCRFNTENMWYFGTSDTNRKTISGTGSEKWMHVAITRHVENGAATHVAYINGVKQFTTKNVTTAATTGNAGLVIGKITKDGAHSSRYVSPSICVADVKVYADLLTDAEIANHYNTELAAYTPSEIDITFADSTGAAITNLDTTDTETGNTVVTMNYTENVASDDIWMVAGCYDADGNLLDYEEVTDITAGTLNIAVPKGTNSIKVFTWKKSIYMPIRTAAVIAKTPAQTE